MHKLGSGFPKRGMQGLLKFACTVFQCPVTTIVLRVMYAQVFGDIHSLGTAESRGSTALSKRWDPV